MSPPTYTDEQAHEILRRVVEREASSPTHSHAHLDHDDLVAAAGELGIGASAVEEAARQVVEDDEIAAVIEQRRARRWHGFYRNLTTYAVITGFLAGIDFGSNGEFVFVPFVALGLGLFSGLQAVRVWFKKEDPENVRGQLRRKKARAAERRDKARRRQRRSEVFEAIVEAGTNALSDLLGQKAGAVPPASSAEKSTYNPAVRVAMPEPDEVEIEVGADANSRERPR